MNIRKNNSGIILIAVIAVMIVLTIVTLSAGSLVSTTMQYTQKEIARTRAMASALAGVNYALHLMQDHPSLVDTWWQSGVRVDNKEQAGKYFDHVVLSKNTQFDVDIMDQTRYLNLNALNLTNASLLSRLIVAHGFSMQQGDDIAANVIEWLTQIKKAPFDDVAELTLVKGMTKDIFEKINVDLTVYPKFPADGLVANFWTASPKFYQALVADVTATHKVENVSTFVALAQKYRTKEKPANPDGVELAMLAAGGHVPVALDYKVHVVGFDALTKTRVEVEALINKDQNGAWGIQRFNRVLF